MKSATRVADDESVAKCYRSSFTNQAIERIGAMPEANGDRCDRTAKQRGRIEKARQVAHLTGFLNGGRGKD